MSTNNANQSTVRRGILDDKTAAECLATLDNVCASGAQCPEVQGSPVTLHALTLLQQATAAAHMSMDNKLALAQALMAAIKVLEGDISAAKGALDVYQTAVVLVAKGSGTVINKAGLPSRARRPARVALGDVTNVTYKEGKNNGEAIVTWPKVPGATAYALQVNMTPENVGGPWTALEPGGGRKRVVQTPTRGAQVLVRVAAIGNGNKQSAWSDPILVTTR